MGIQQRMQRLGPLGQLGQIALLERLRERVEQAPDVAGRELVVARIAPFVENGWDQAIGPHPNIRGADDQVMDCHGVEPLRFVGIETDTLIVPLLQHPPDSSLDQLGQVTYDKPGVLAAEF